ncbi:hypothetical protein E2R51_14170 [Jeotgalibacillus sp. S-D1]|uniref:hypothetical protein n=1 Tax=Jeotgalibacillus sp. S-D1 TaxID=2552189 RepID=UPI0010599718|nr:hypothetical protein [Jeotgalibacillus sp. S-D1]TDL31503.1 hypothetical protein E2R51_14170 [Jeotgalibacillus sp. S-D1]
MKKFSLSLIGGVIIGLFLSFLLMDYEDIRYDIQGLGGIESRTIREMDFDFVFNASFIIVGISILIFVIWTVVEKKSDEKFLSKK